MSDNFTDTNSYASSLNLNGDSKTANHPSPSIPTRKSSNPHLIPLAPNVKPYPQQIQPAPAAHAMHRANSTPPPLLPANKKRPSDPNPEEFKQPLTKRKTASGDEHNKLNALATIATHSPEQVTPGPGGKGSSSQSQQPAGHRPVTSCTHCRQHKIKCNASEKYPGACTRCEKMGLSCEIDPQFRPRKGSQIQSLRNDVDELKLKIEYLQRNESLIAQALANQQASNQFMKNDHTPQVRSPLNAVSSSEPTTSPRTSAKTILKREPHLLMDRRQSTPSSRQSSSPNSIPQLLNDSAPTNSDQRDLPPFLEMSVRANSPVPGHDTADNSPQSHRSGLSSSNSHIYEFILGDVQLSLAKANELHDRFIKDYLPFFPIMSSSSASELYSQSQLLFWTVILTACLSDPEPSLYNQLSSLIKQLAIETCWIRTPRSTHISQALLILCMWPLPNQKVLDDCSYRFVGLAKSLGYQLGLHRGKFMSEFSRTQVSLPDAEKWRTRSWLGVFFAEQFWASQLGLPPSSQTDYLIENARVDKNLPKNFRSLISLAIFQAKLVNVMGSSVVSPDGLMEARNRAGSLAILERELERLVFKLEIDQDQTEIYYLYVKLTVCCFAFLPETPTEDQTKYVTVAYLAATRVITLVSKLLERKNLIELPIYIRQAVTYAALILFKLHLTPLLLDKYIDSARQSIVTVHRLFRNQLSAWKNVENDISRTAQVLEKLNYVLFTHPDLFTENDGIITTMRSHLTGSLFYDLVYCVHEAKRRTLEEQKDGKKPQPPRPSGDRKRPVPLPFYNQINKDDFQTITTTTPGGTTITTLVPTENAMSTATADATAAGLAKPTEIKGIPVDMLESTGATAASNIKHTAPPASTSPNLRRVASKNSMAQADVFTPRPANFETPSSQAPYTFNGIVSPGNIPFDMNSPGATGASTGSQGNRADFDSFFQQQGAGNWMEGNDDFLGWFDMNMAPEF